MVEMLETASILRHATRRSLVILDEIGRGTSTYDGVAIAQSVVEYLHDFDAGTRGRGDAENPSSRLGGGPRTLFATHYHELAELEQALPRVRNYRMEVLEDGEQVVFLHRVVPGSADRSYGIQVARLAGVPRQVTQRAAEVLRELEAQRLRVMPSVEPPANKATVETAIEVANGTFRAGSPQEEAAIPPDEAGPDAGVSTATGLDSDGAEAGGRAGDWTGVTRPARRNGRALALVKAVPVADPEAPVARAMQLALFVPSHPLLDELKALDVMNMTPLEALNRLAALAKQAREA
jgi:DNA mismatch repair protein MutS